MTSADLTPMYTQEQLGNGGYNANASVGAFFWWERLDSVTVNLYEYCLGHGIAGWELSAEPHKIRVKDFTLSESNITIHKGETANIQAIITPSDAADQDVTWRYSPTNRSSKLSNNGLTATFTSTKVQTYTITATLGDFKAECVVNVVDDTTGVEDVEATTDEPTKSIQDGRLLIKHGQQVYNVLGQQIR
jgi:hypothetical protein